MATINLVSTHDYAIARHNMAMASPRGGFEGPLAFMFAALKDYAVAHRARYESPIGEDYVLGDHWRDALKSFVGLLNGDLGRLDAGELDKAARALAVEHGFTADFEDKK